MEYEIKLSGTPFDDGAIDLDRLEIIAQHLHDIAKGSLQIRMFGSSQIKGRETQQVTQSLKIRLRGLSRGSTVLHLECQPFRETLRNVQGNLFHQEIVHETVAQQLERQIAARKTVGNQLSQFIGILADAEGDYENDLKMLSE